MLLITCRNWRMKTADSRAIKQPHSFEMNFLLSLVTPSKRKAPDGDESRNKRARKVRWMTTTMLRRLFDVIVARLIDYS